MHQDWNNIDFSPLTRLVKPKFFAIILRKVGILSEKRFHRLLQILPDTIKWDLRKGIPFKENTFDVVYHSHFLEHLDQKATGKFLKECYRVLKPSGLIRVVIPDLEIVCGKYLHTFQELPEKETSVPEDMEKHQQSILDLLGQMVVTEPGGTAEQPPFVRMIERFIRGDTARMGDIHRWMYDKYTLKELLLKTGFRDIQVESQSTGRIQGWTDFCLDTNEDGSIYKPNSIYVEAIK